MSFFDDLAAGCTVRAVWALQDAAASAQGNGVMATDEIGQSVYSILKAAGALANARAKLTAQPDLAPAEYEAAALRVVECFNKFADAAKRAPKPLAVRITLD